MPKFLSFGNGILAEVPADEQFRKRMLNVWRVHQEILWELQVAVILQHTRIKNFRITDTVKFIKVRVIKSHTDFNRTISAEIEENNTVIIFNGSDRFTVLGNNKSRQILIDNF